MTSTRDDQAIFQVRRQIHLNLQTFCTIQPREERNLETTTWRIVVVGFTLTVCRRAFGHSTTTLLQAAIFLRSHSQRVRESGSPGACFSKVPKLFGRISGDIILFVSSKLRRLEARNFAVSFIFIPFTKYEKTSFAE